VGGRIRVLWGGEEELQGGGQTHYLGEGRGESKSQSSPTEKNKLNYKKTYFKKHSKLNN